MRIKDLSFLIFVFPMQDLPLPQVLYVTDKYKYGKDFHFQVETQMEQFSIFNHVFRINFK